MNQAEFNEDLASQDSEVKRMFDTIIEFTDRQYVNIVSKGEISKGTFTEIRNILYTVKNLKQKFKSSGKSKIEPKIKFSGMSSEIEVSRPTFIDVVNTVEKEKKTDILKDEQKLNMALGILRGEAFDDPESFLDKYDDSIKLKSVFEQVDGVFIVNEEKGFYWIPGKSEDQLATVLRFNSVSQGKPKFAFLDFGASSVSHESFLP